MKRLFTLLTLLLMIAGTISAQTYTSMADGDLNDTSIWSLDGGATHCSCAPTTELPTYSVMNMGSVEMFHTITAPKDVIVIGIGLVVDIHPNASFSGNVELELRSGVINNYDVMAFEQVTVFNSGYLFSTGYLSVSPGDLINAWQGRMDLGGQVEVPGGNIPNLGWINILNNAQVTAGGQITNDGIVNIEPGACVNVTGDFLNNVEVNLINGPGSAYVQSATNITNVGFWDTDVDWCANGTGTGLTHASNCSNCGTLPVELVAFEAQLENGQVILNWQTGSESGNSHFTVERSIDGTSFDPLIEVASESPLHGKLYSALDPAPFRGVSWYRLSQTDQDGKTTRLETVMMVNEGQTPARLTVFPNPFGETFKLSTFGLEGASMRITLTDLTGREIVSTRVDQTTDFEVYRIDPGKLEPGVYLVTLHSKSYTESVKLLHQ